MAEKDDGGLDGHAVTVGATSTVQNCAGRPRGEIWQFFTVVPGLQYSHGVHYVHCNLFHPDPTSNGVVETIAAMSDRKERTTRANKAKMIADKPIVMARHLRFVCDKITDEAQNMAKLVLDIQVNKKNNNANHKHITA